jgi:hemoglobin-like flavoprotein
LVGDLFYTKLFTDNPRIRNLFPQDMTAQNKKLTDMLTSIITSIDRIDGLKKDIDDMARRHVKYNVKPEHYDLVGKSLLWTLEQGLGSDWNQDVKNAWVSCYTTLAERMLAEYVH